MKHCDSKGLKHRLFQVSQYQFTLSWSAIFPDGTGTPNASATHYYNKVIDEVIKAGMRPVVVMAGQELPQTLMDLGGWTNSKMPEWFKSFAVYCFRTFGDMVRKYAFNNIVVSAEGMRRTEIG